MKYLIILGLLILSGCNAPAKSLVHYEIKVFDTLIVCENIKTYTYGVTLTDCKTVLQNNRIPNIEQATNFIEVPKDSIY